MAIQLERLEKTSFKQSFYERMEELNYDRYIEMDKYVPPKFDKWDGDPAELQPKALK